MKRILLIASVLLQTYATYYDMSWHMVGNVVTGVTYVLLGYLVAAWKDKIRGLSTNILIMTVIVGELFSLAMFMDVIYDFSQLGIIVSATSLFMLAVNNHDYVLSKKIEYIGRVYSLNIYIFHILVAMVLARLLNYMGVSDDAGLMMIKPIFVVIMTLLLAAIINKIMSLITNKIRHGDNFHTLEK